MNEPREIKSLQDYISVLDENFKGNYYYRGESMNFGPTKNMASGYRWMRQDDKRRFLDLTRMRSAYFREIGVHLNAQETSNFIAYAQHHGLPTELLDITKNPLVALYFAVSDCKDEDGFVYLFDNNLYSGKEPDKNQFFSNLYDPEFSSLNHLPVNKQYYWFYWTEYLDKESIQFNFYKSVNLFVYRIFRESKDTLSFEIENESQKTMLVETDKEIYNSIESNFIRRENARNTLKNEVQGILEVFNKIFNLDIADAFQLIDATRGKYFPTLKYLLIQPSIVFDRMKNQQGLFIYQLNTSRGSDHKGYVQPIDPCETLKISREYKENILNQLNNIGINQMFIYSDDDNTATYYKENFKRSVHEEGNQWMRNIF